MNDSVYARTPLEMRRTIPVFSVPNEYTENYARIAADHLQAIRDRHIANPFIPEELWVQLEDSTAKLIEKYSKSGDMILDVGVGLGRLLSRFANLQRYGMDISFDYLEVAQAKGIEVCYAMVEDMPYKESTFDIVTCTDILEHVLDLNLSLAKMLSVIKKGGTLIVRVPYREDLRAYALAELPYKYIHLRNFDEYSLKLVFEKIFNCEVAEMTGGGYEPRRSRRRWPLPVPAGPDAILRRFLYMIKAHKSRALYEGLLRLVYHPIEINVVVQKK